MSTPIDQGMRARELGGNRNENPYTQGSMSRVDWYLGWMDMDVRIANMPSPREQARRQLADLLRSQEADQGPLSALADYIEEHEL